MTIETFIITTFLIIVVFSAINTLINSIIFFTSKQSIYIKLAFFWFALIINFIIQSKAQSEEFWIIMAYSSCLIPLNLLSYSTLSFIKQSYPKKIFIPLAIGGVLLTVLTRDFAIPFTLRALPISLAAAIPQAYVVYQILWRRREQATLLLKCHAGILLLLAIHTVNFALFRMVPEAQLWGWPVAYALYQLLACIIPAITLDFYHRDQEDYLTSIIEQKTKTIQSSNQQLAVTLQQKNFLLRNLSHDISNPISVIKSCLELNDMNLRSPEDTLVKVKSMCLRVEGLISQVKDFERVLSDGLNVKIEEINLKTAIDESLILFEERIQSKKILVKYDKKELSAFTILAEKRSISNSIFSNIFSNALKFTKPSGEVNVQCHAINSTSLKVCIRDEGIGIPKSILDNLFDFDSATSRSGTAGELGTGFGLPIIRKMMNAIDGDIKVLSQEQTEGQKSFTEVQLTFKLANPAVMRNAS